MKSKNRRILILTIFILILAIFFVSKNSLNSTFQLPDSNFWQMQAIDTVKYSRDTAGQHLNDLEFDKVIEDQVKKIADTGATHVALGTPYDERFIPYLKRWVNISRKYNLKIWFRGNFSGWEEWFNFDPISREDHKKLLKEFIKNNGDLFEDGDFFTSCTECENGGAGDPRLTGDISGFRQFLIDEYQISKNEFRLIGKNVYSNLYPMNFDVAYLVMNEETTKALGGIVTIDHYVATPERTNNDINIIADRSKGKVVLGEFGAPIPDIHGLMSEDDQALWIDDAFKLLINNKNLIGINYWTAFGGSTKLWNDDRSERKAVSIIKKYYSPNQIKGYVVDETGKPIENVQLTINNLFLNTDKLGRFSIPLIDPETLLITKDGYSQRQVQITPSPKTFKVILAKENPSTLYNLQKLINSVIISL